MGHTEFNVWGPKRKGGVDYALFYGIRDPHEAVAKMDELKKAHPDRRYSISSGYSIGR